MEIVNDCPTVDSSSMLFEFVEESISNTCIEINPDLNVEILLKPEANKESIFNKCENEHNQESDIAIFVEPEIEVNLNTSDMFAVDTITAQNDKIMSITDWKSTAKLCFKAVNPSTKTPNNYLRGCIWSPDGTCLLTNSNDNIMRIYELPRECYGNDMYKKDFIPSEIKPVLNVKELDLIYDYCWYPFMNSNNPDSCLFASTSRKGAVRLWDAYHGTERAYVQPYDHLVEPVSAQSIAFSRDGVKMYCGFNRCLRVFDLARLNSTPERRPQIGQKSELRGIISCIATSPVNIGMYGCGSFSKDAAIYHEQSGDRILEFLRTDDRIGGITHIEFSPVDMNVVATGGRIDNAVHLWDLRSPGSPIYGTIKRDVRTNQRIYFQFESSGQYLVTGNHSGHVTVYDIHGATSPEDDHLMPKVADWTAHGDVCNGLSLHPSLAIVATASGQRRLIPPWRRSGMLRSVVGDDDDSDWSSSDDDDAEVPEENEVRVWALDLVPGVAGNKC